MLFFLNRLFILILSPASLYLTFNQKTDESRFFVMSIPEEPQNGSICVLLNFVEISKKSDLDL